MRDIINITMGELTTAVDNEVMKAVQKVGIDVNKEELLKALELYNNLVRCKECKHRESCCRPCYKSADSYCSDGEREDEPQTCEECEHWNDTEDGCADRHGCKTENNSEKPNNCEAKNYCDDCLYTDTCDSKEFFYACTSKATISKMEQVETMSCQECKHFHENAVMYLDQCDFCFKDCKYEPKKDDGYYQTHEIRTNTHECVKDTHDKTEPNCSEIPNNCDTCRFELYWPEMCEGCCEWDSHYEPKDEPQTERSSE